MSRTVGFLALCVILAIIQAAVVALVAVLLLGLLISFVTRPRETLAFLSTLAVMALISAHPVTCIVTAGIFATAVVIAGAIRRRRHPPLLADHGDHLPPDPKRLDRDPLG